MAEYHKVLQLYRSTNVWATKNIAKAEVEIHAKQFHPELNPSSPLGLKDGEQIVARYYDKGVFNYGTFSYIPYGTDPYQTTPYDTNANSANHVWVDGFDSFATMPPANSVNYDSAAYIRVGNDDDVPYVYYKLTSTNTPTQGDVSSIFGVVYRNETLLYIEWFDSADAAQAVIDKLNYTDKDLEQGFVSAVHQEKGKVLAIHGNITSKEAISVVDNHYAYVKLQGGTAADAGIPADYVWVEGGNIGTTVPTQGLSETSYKYYHVSNTTPTDADGFYELRKNIEVSLVIDDSGNNILAQGLVRQWKTLQSEPQGVDWTGKSGTELPAITAESDYYRIEHSDASYSYYQAINVHAANSGLSTNLTLRSLTPDEVSKLGNNVKEGYKLVGTANGAEKQIGETIKIYKDSSLYKTYLGTVDDGIVNMFAWKNSTTSDILYTDTKTPTASTSHTYTQNAPDLQGHITYTQGTYDVSAYDSTKNTITVDGRKYTYQGSGKPWEKPAEIYTKWVNGNSAVYTKGTETPTTSTTYYTLTEGAYTEGGTVSSVGDDNTITCNNVVYAQSDTVPSEALVFIYYKVDDTYEIVKVNVESFLQENEFKDGLNVNTNHTVEVKLASDAGIEFKPEGTGVNKSLRIKIDTTDGNKYYRVYNSVTDSGMQRYKYDVDNWTEPDTMPEPTESSATYVLFEGKYYEKVQNGSNYEYVEAGGPYKRDSEGAYVKDTYLHTTEKGLTIDQPVLENKITDSIGKNLTVNGEGFVKQPNGELQAVVTGTDIQIAGNESTKKDSLKVRIKDCGEGPISNLPTTRQTEGTYFFDFIEYNGLIYKWNGNAYILYNFDETTNLNEAVSILEYLTYNLDMGTFTVTYQ